jgi:heterotetrameric sarcosine oxidase gamma subunit
VPDSHLQSRTGLESIVLPGRYGASADAPGVVILLRQKLALASVIVRRGRHAELAARVAETFNVDLPMTPGHVGNDRISFVWAGSGQWLGVSENAAPDIFEKDLRRDLAGVASVINQSDGRTVARISGPMVRETLAKGVPIDLDPVSFARGETALTRAGHINVQFWQLDIGTYEFVFFRSFAVAFFEWLIEAANEFGILIEN